LTAPRRCDTGKAKMAFLLSEEKMNRSWRGKMVALQMVLVAVAAVLHPCHLLAGEGMQVVKEERTAIVPFLSFNGKTYILLDRTALELLEVKTNSLGGKRVRIEGGGMSLVLTEGRATASFGAESVRLSSPPVRRREGWAIPADFFHLLLEKRFGDRVLWEEGKRKVRIAPDARRLVGVRHCTYPDRTRVVAEWSRDFTYSWTRSPGLLILSVKDGLIPPAIHHRAVADGLVESIDFGSGHGAGTMTVRTSLSHPRVRIFSLQDPPRLVADIYRDEGEREIPQGFQSSTSKSVSLASTAVSPPAGRKLKLIIDPGHGGEDPGAIGPTGLREKDIVLDVGLRLRDLAAEKLGMEAVMTRADDRFVPLKERAAIANRAKGDLFVSIHANASLHGRCDGFETFYLSQEASDNEAREAVIRENSSLQLEAVEKRQADLIKSILWDMVQTEYIDESSLLASLIQEELARVQRVTNRGVKTAPFYVLMGAAMPAVLVEVAFISHPEGERRLGEVGYRQLISEALTQAIGQFQGHLVKRLGLDAIEARGQVERPS